jgi:hypothetical protein
MDPRAGLDRGLLITTHHEVAGLKQLPVPAPLVQIEDPAGLLRELRVAREDPGAVVPRADRVLAQPPPDRDGRDRRDDPTLDRLEGQLSAGPARERHALLGRQLARHRLDLGDLRRGKNAAVDPTAVSPRAPGGRPGRTVFARSRPPDGSTQAAQRSPCSKAHQRPAGSPSRASHPDTVRSTPPRAAQAHAAVPRSTPPYAGTSAACHQIRRPGYVSFTKIRRVLERTTT